MAVSEILIIGDSVFKGVIFDSARQRYAILKDSAERLLSQWLPFPIINRSQMGRTAPEGLKLLREQPKENLKDRVVVLEFGGNDCDYDWKAVAEDPERPHQPRTPAGAFMDAMSEMVGYVRSCGGRPLLSTLPPLDCDRYFDWITRGGLNRENILRFIGEKQRIYRWQEYYSSLVLHLAAALSCDCVPVREAFLESVLKGDEVLCADGIHPNAQGHKLIADAAYRFAQNLFGEILLPANA